MTYARIDLRKNGANESPWKSVVKRFLVVFSSWLLAPPLYALTIPLGYDLTNGVYTFTVLLREENKFPLKLMLDTGSSNLNVVGNKDICPNCKVLVEHLNYFNPNSPTKNLKKEFKMRYGLGKGVLRKYQGRIRLLHPGIAIDNFNFGVYIRGYKINNIAGFAYPQAASPLKKPMPDLFDKLNKKYNFHDQFSLMLCDSRAPSSLFLGPLPEKMSTLVHHSVPIIKQDLYYIKQYGVSDDKGQRIIDFPMGADAIVDSGTSAKIVFLNEPLTHLIAYLKDNTSKKNLALPDEFWEGTVCMPDEMVDPNNLPTLYFHFKDSQGKSFKLAIPPQRYITSSSCGEDYYKFAFMGYTANKINGNTQHHKRNYPPFIILGTPFIEEYMTTFQQYNPAQLSFYNSEALCHKDKLQ